MDIESSIKLKLNKILNINTHKKININNINTLVLSGGGIKGLYYIGIFKKLEELNIINNIKNISGTSIGAFFGALLSIGFTSKDLADFVLLFNLSKIKHPNIKNFFSFFGIDDGNNFEIILENMFILKGFTKNTTFKELYEKTKINLVITGVCINEKKCHYFSHENTPNMNVIKSIRISTSVPLYFNPVIYESKLWVDGGLIDNYPISIFKNTINNVLGIYLSEENSISEITNLEDYFISIISSLAEGIAQKSIYGFENNTIIIKSLNKNILDTNFSKEKIIHFINYGYNSINEYI